MLQGGGARVMWEIESIFLPRAPHKLAAPWGRGFWVSEIWIALEAGEQSRV